MSDFADVKIIDLAAPGKWSLNGGPFGSKLVSSMYVDEGVPVIRGANLPMDQRFLDENFVYVSEAKADELRAHTAGPGDVVVTQRGTLGQVGLIPPSARHQRYVISQSQMKLTVNPTVADAGYVYYSFRAPEIIGRFVALASTSGVPHVNLQTLRDFSIPLPSLDTQRRIASILGAYDDLIEVNQRRVAVLEETARMLFEEWFVRFRFPGHESVPLVDTPDGPLPDPKTSGWARVKVGAVLKKLRRPPKIKRQDYLNHGPIPCIDQGIDFIGGYTLDEDAVVHEPLPICVFGDHTRILKFVTFPFASGADGTQLLYPIEPMTPEYLHFSLINIDLSNQHYARHFKFLKDQEIWLPPSELVETFTSIVKPKMTLVQNLRDQCTALAASRDLLLPRLISGQLSVETADRELELAA